MKYLFFGKSERRGVGSKVRIGENMPIYSSSLDYAVILWRKGDLSIVDADGLRVVDFSKGYFRDLPTDIQSRIVNHLNACGSERDLVIWAHKLLPMSRRNFAREQNGEMQTEYMSYLQKIQVLSLSTDYYPVIKPSGFGFEFLYKELSLSKASMSDVALDSLFRLLTSEVSVSDFTSLFGDGYDLVAVPDRVRSFIPLKDLSVSLKIKRNIDYPNKKRLRKEMEAIFPPEKGVVEKLRSRIIGLLAKEPRVEQRGACN